MDIQVSSNFERLLFEAGDRDAAKVRRYMAGLKQSGGFTVEEQPLQRIRSEFDAGRATMEQVAATIVRERAASGYLLDPHTAAAVAVADEMAGSTAPIIVLATAHPAKFPDAVERAAGVRPHLPARLAGIMEKPEKFEVLPSDAKMVKEYVSQHARAGA